MICYNTNNSVRNNQAFLQECLNIAYHLGAELHDSFEPINLSVRFTKKRKDLFKFILEQVATHKRAFPSHATMQRVTGLSRSAVMRALNIFESLGLIDIDHRNLMHKTNIYSLGPVLRNATIVRSLQATFKVIVPAFCRTMERLGNLMFAKKPKEVYTGYFKRNATLSLRDVFVFSNTNTNTSLLIDNSSKNDHNLSSQIKKGENVYEVYKKHKDSEEEKDHGYMERMNKVAIADTKSQMSTADQVTKCMNETYLPKRIEMFKEISHTVHKASKPYIEFLIRKYTKKMELENGLESW